MFMHFVLIIFGLWLIVSFPEMILVIIALLAILFILRKYGKDFTSAKTNNSDNDDDTIDWKSYYKQRNDKSMKPNFRDDPEWQAGIEKLNKLRKKNKIISERELQNDINKELNEKEQTFWSKT